MRSLLSIRFLIISFAIWFALLSFPIQTACQEIKHVLVLHSYNQGLTWTDSEDAGIRSVLNTRASEIEVHTEYLDTKIASDESYYQKYFELLKHKYASTNFNIIIATDDDAYNFYLKYQRVLFPGVPVVFCGVNNFKDSQREGREDFITGVVEAFDIPSTSYTKLLKCQFMVFGIFILEKELLAVC